ncbi:MAG TPA: TerC/Alx family metal homeostasis membrane protein [Polyangia bacterium]|nr:TerC/Alx family metal homeostasis membrane protein [Polyangia bacterium]
MSPIGTPLLWVGFLLLILSLLALDLAVFHRKPRPERLRAALLWTLVWIGLALLFNLGLYLHFGSQKALEFLTGYVIEKALSVDNVFVFAVIFSYFAVPPALQHRVLFWGILGALLLRALFIVAGAALLSAFHWFVYVFGGVLLLTSLKLLRHRHALVEPERNPLVRLFRRFLPIAAAHRGVRFFVIEAGRRCATPLLLALVAVEASDIVFAIDSIPVIFAVTQDPFIVFTSNIFALLGLRALYSVLLGALGKLRYLHVGLALVLAFVGAKMLLSGVLKVPIGISLAVVGALLGAAIAASLARRPGAPKRAPAELLP